MSIPHVTDGETDLDSALFNPIIDRVNGIVDGTVPIALAGIEGALGEWSQQGGVIRAVDYISAGVDPTGAADSYAGLVTAIAGMEPGATLDLGNGNVYRLSDDLVFTEDFRVIGKSTILYPRTTPAITVAPSWGDEYAVSAFANEVYPSGVGTYCAKLTIDDASEFSPGDIVQVYSDDAMAANAGAKRGELKVVVGVDTGALYLGGLLQDTYTTNPRVRLHPALSVEIDGPTFSADGDPTVDVGSRATAAIEANGLGPNSSIRCRFTDTWSRGLFLIAGYGVTADVSALRCRDDTANQAHGYGVSLGPSCRACDVRASGAMCRHVVTTNVYTALSPGWYGGPRDCMVRDGIADSCTAAGYDTHEGSYDIVFSNCHSRNQNEGEASLTNSRHGFSNRGANTTYIGCSYRGFGGLLLESGGAYSHGVESTTVLIGCTDEITDAEYAVENNQQVITTTAGDHESGSEIALIGCRTRNKRLISQPRLHIRAIDCQLVNCPNLRIAADRRLSLHGCERVWEADGTQEPIRLNSGSVLDLEDYVAEGAHSNSSLVRGVTGGTWTVNASNVRSRTSGVAFKSDDGSGSWSVTDTTIAVA